MRTRRDFPSLRQLRAFRAVAYCNSIGGGAKELGLSQPAVTQMIFQLETALAAKLLERRRSGSFLTPFGDVLLTRVQRLFAQIQSALSNPAIGASLSGRETTNPWKARSRIRISVRSPRSQSAVPSRRHSEGSTFPSRRCIDPLAISSACFAEPCINGWREDWARPHKHASWHGD